MKAGLEARRFRVQAVVEPHHAGAWGSSLVKILDGETQIGEYKRNHPGWAEQTFEPFESNGAWYALYSRDYTSTRVMSLPDCTDLGGEEPAPNGFCPVEFYVPRYKKVARTNRANGQETEDWLFEVKAEGHSRKAADDYDHDLTFSPWLSLATGFVAGCVWGDDSSWKLEVVDLSKAADGTISRSARFGYLELVDGMSLAESLRFERKHSALGLEGDGDQARASRRCHRKAYRSLRSIISRPA